MEAVTEVLPWLAGMVFGAGHIALLTAIYFKLGRGQAKFEEVFRRIEALEQWVHDLVKGERHA